MKIFENNTVRVNEAFMKEQLELIEYKHDAINTGFIDWDYQQGGIVPGRMYLIGGRPAMGKTAFALNILKSVAIGQGIPTAYFSLELSNEHLIRRLLSIEANVDWQSIRRADVKVDQWENVLEASERIQNGKIILNDTTELSIEDFTTELNKCEFEDVKVVIIDYLQVVKTSYKVESKDLELLHICKILKELADQKDIAIIVLTQLSRETEEREEHRPLLSDIKDSEDVIGYFDTVSFIYRDEYYDYETELKGIAEIITKKSRYGNCGTVNLAWLPEYQRFCNLEKM